ncbi:MAG: hypothetical protein WD802_05910 [Gemmatimonadaceae bacterium]
MVAWLPSTQARGPRPLRVLTSFALIVATLFGPACNDATAPNSLVPSPSFIIVSGDDQTGTAGKELPEPLVAKATTSGGAPIAGLTLFFVVTHGGGKLYAGGGVTNSSGIVQDYWTLGPVAGAHQAVQVRTVNPTTGVKKSHGNFTATAVAGPAAIIKLSAGDGQTAFTRALVPIKPAAQVTDALGNGVAGVSVTFAVAAGGGSVSGATAVTNASGVATVSAWRLGRAPGTNNNRLTATKTGLTGSPVTFTASAKFGMRVAETGLYHGCGLSAGNDVYCWGWNGFGQLGEGGLAATYLAPVKLANTTLLPTSIHPAYIHTCMRLPTGKVWCMGDNSAGQLGTGTFTTPISTPVEVQTTQTFTRIAAAYATTCGLTSGDVLWCWGYNSTGQFGNGNTTSSGVPEVGGGGISFKSVALGTSHACGRTAAGPTWCWGANGSGQLGNATFVGNASPVLVSGELVFTSIELGSIHSCGLVASGKAYCWGANGSGQLGDGGGTDANSPQPVLGDIAFTQLAAGEAHTCGITSTGVAYCWGDNANGELGVGTTGAPVFVPTLVAGGRTFSAISAGTSRSTCGVPVGGGHPFCWGFNPLGQLGNGTTTSSALPVAVVTPPIP